MALVIFYEKPGCIANTRQKALLRQSGHDLDLRSILTETWDTDSLGPFLRGTPVATWFNKTAPRVKSGEVKPEALSEDEALALMVEDPILIRRPLMQVGETRRAGFDQDQVDAWIGLLPPQEAVTDSCPRSDAETQ
ncbi:MAG: hypothetical protein OIF40_00755 [Mangrovicoccus sp.]|nr:hypothetical protein [Mangrovicoccus sp.]